MIDFCYLDSIYNKYYRVVPICGSIYIILYSCITISML